MAPVLAYRVRTRMPVASLKASMAGPTRFSLRPEYRIISAPSKGLAVGTAVAVDAGVAVGAASPQAANTIKTVTRAASTPPKRSVKWFSICTSLVILCT